MAKENKLFEVIRKHPNPESKHALTVGTNKYQTGDKVGFNVFVKANGSEKDAEVAIERAKKFGWIKDYSVKKETKKEEVKKDEKDSKSTTTK